MLRSEGDSGSKTLAVSVSLDHAWPEPVTYDIGTADGNNDGCLACNATSGSDYAEKTLAGETIPPGELSREFTITTFGDTIIEDNELLYALVSNMANATNEYGGSGTDGVAYINNDDFPALTVGDASVVEGASGTKALAFAVTLVILVNSRRWVHYGGVAR